MFDIQKQFCQHEWFKKHPWLDCDLVSEVICYLYKHRNSLGNLKNGQSKEERPSQSSIGSKEAISIEHCHRRVKTWLRLITLGKRFNYLAFLSNQKTLTDNLIVGEHVCFKIKYLLLSNSEFNFVLHVNLISF